MKLLLLTSFVYNYFAFFVLAQKYLNIIISGDAFEVEINVQAQ